MGPLFLLIGLVFFVAPFVLIGLAWRWFRNNPKPLTQWRRYSFSVAAVGSTVNSAVMLIFFLVHNVGLRAMGYLVHGRITVPSVMRVEQIVEWAGVICSASFCALAFTGAGKARICVIAAAFFSFLLWRAALA